TIARPTSRARELSSGVSSTRQSYAPRTTDAATPYAAWRLCERVGRDAGIRAGACRANRRSHLVHGPRRQRCATLRAAPLHRAGAQATARRLWRYDADAIVS